MVADNMVIILRLYTKREVMVTRTTAMFSNDSDDAT